MRRTFLLPLVAAFAVLPFIGCGGGSSPAWQGHTTGPKVAVSFAPLYCFAANVVGDNGTVKSALSTRGPHDAEVGTDERTMLETADIVLLVGLGLDDNIATALKAGGRGKAKVVELGEQLDESLLRDGDGHDAKGAKKPAKPGHEGHNHGPLDPHVWLSPTLAVELVKAMRAELRTANPNAAADYDRNAAAYIEKLKKLSADGKALLKGKTEKKFVTMHESLGYFADEFGLEIVGFLQKSPGIESTGKEIAELVETCKKSGTRVIAVEPQYSAAGAKTLIEAMTQAGIKDAAIVTLDPIETATAAELTADLYETKMRANLDALNKVLK